jgi:hypothetical protein
MLTKMSSNASKRSNHYSSADALVNVDSRASAPAFFCYLMRSPAACAQAQSGRAGDARQAHRDHRVDAMPPPHDGRWPRVRCAAGTIPYDCPVAEPLEQ